MKKDTVKALEELWTSASVSSETRRIAIEAIEALETSDKAVERAINKIASELKHWMHCSGCPVNCVWGTDIKMCDELLAEWMKGIIEE